MRGPSFRTLLLSVVVAVAAPIVASGDDVKRPPNILFLLSDDQRPDTVAAHGNKVIETPNLDALARRGATFTRAVCANPICTPSRAEILTGCCGFRNGVNDFGGKFRADIALWPETMRQAGYHTWYVGKWHNHGRPNTRGYEESRGLYAGGGGKWVVDKNDWKGSPITGYRGWIFQTDEGEKFPEKGVGLTPDISARFADAAIEFIERKPDKPFFLHVNFTAPHDPLIMPPGYEDRYPANEIPLPENYLPKHPFDHGNYEGRDEKLMNWPREKKAVKDVIAMYYRVITHMDAQIGRILRALEQAGHTDNTIVIFSSDHGVGVGSHGIRGKQNMYEHTIGVPLIIAGPNIPSHVTRDAQVYLRDLFPTVCELTSIAIPASVQGKSLKKVIAGDVDAIHPHVFCYFRNFQRMIRTDRWKLIYYPHLDRYQLFDLNQDPHEIHDLATNAEYAATQKLLIKQLQESQTEWEDPLIK